MRKQTGKIGTLPLEIREQLCARLRDNTTHYPEIAAWLLSCPIPPDNLPFSNRYAASAGPQRACEVAISRWYQSPDYARLDQAAGKLSDESRIAKNLIRLYETTDDAERDKLMLSVIQQGMIKVARGQAKTSDITNLTYAHCAIRGLKKDDAAVKVLETKLRAIADGSVTGVADLDYKGRLDLLNKALEEGFKA